MTTSPNRRAARRQVARTGAWLVATCALLLPSVVHAGDRDRVAVLVTAGASYRVAAEAAIQRLRTAQVNCELVVVPTGDAQARRETLGRLRESATMLIVSGGTAISEEALKAVPDVPVVFLMMPNALDAGFLDEQSPYRGRVAGVTSDIDPGRQVEWTRAAQPDCKRVAVLFSDRSERTAAALESAGSTAGIKITPLRTNRDEFAAAIDALDGGEFEGVIMLPDSQVYNSSTVQRLLLWGLRQKRPVWAFSESIVEAGALAGIQCDQGQVGSQAAEVALRIRAGASPRSIGLCYPQRVERAVNLYTASMIGVTFRDDALASHVKKFGGP